MSKANCYYRIDDAETLAKIDAFFEKRDQFHDQVKALCETYGVESYSRSDSVFGGLQFHHLIAERDQEIDETKFRTSKNKDRRYKNLKPKRTNKEFCAEYDALVPKPVSYDELTALILGGNPSWRDIFPRSYGYRYRKGHPFYFETTLTPCAHAVEVVGSEYLNAYKDQDDE